MSYYRPEPVAGAMVVVIMIMTGKVQLLEVTRMVGHSSGGVLTHEYVKRLLQQCNENIMNIHVYSAKAVVDISGVDAIRQNCANDCH
jgi:hypothetical protein